MTNILAIPDLQTSVIPQGWFLTVAVPRINESPWSDLDAAETKLKAAIAYLEGFDGDATDLEKALRVIEKRRGELLGEPERGGRGNLSAHEKVSAAMRTRYRTLARWWDEVLWPVVQAAKSRHEVSQSHLLKLVKEQTTPTEDICPDGKYHTIVVDPPWRYQNNSGRQRQEYADRTLSLEEIKSFDVKRWKAEDFCHLYLWVTDLYAGRVFEVTESWGFTPKCWIVWVKTTKDGNGEFMGMGNYYRHQHEFCVFATSGNKRLKRKNASSVLYAPTTIHSEKPDAFYNLVETCSFDPFIDVFARKHRAGWDVFGDRIQKSYQLRLGHGKQQSILVA